jgi:hypothetical protein
MDDIVAEMPRERASVPNCRTVNYRLVLDVNHPLQLNRRTQIQTSIIPARISPPRAKVQGEVLSVQSRVCTGPKVPFVVSGLTALPR